MICNPGQRDPIHSAEDEGDEPPATVMPRNNAVPPSRTSELCSESASAMGCEHHTTVQAT
jgi:hypothetical protein